MFQLRSIEKVVESYSPKIESKWRKVKSRNKEFNCRTGPGIEKKIVFAYNNNKTNSTSP